MHGFTAPCILFRPSSELEAHGRRRRTAKRGRKCNGTTTPMHSVSKVFMKATFVFQLRPCSVPQKCSSCFFQQLPRVRAFHVEAAEECANLPTFRFPMAAPPCTVGFVKSLAEVLPICGSPTEAHQTPRALDKSKITIPRSS